MTPARPPSVTCPNCQAQVPWNETSVWRPFCSQRCRLIDLGEWLDESHRIPAETMPDGQDIDLAAPDYPH